MCLNQVDHVLNQVEHVQVDHVFKPRLFPDESAAITKSLSQISCLQ